MNAAEAQKRALELCRGSYQVSIILGTSRLSGADLKGKAKDYSAHYASSRHCLLSRLCENGIPFRTEEGKNGRHILLLGDPYHPLIQLMTGITYALNMLLLYNHLTGDVPVFCRYISRKYKGPHTTLRRMVVEAIHHDKYRKAERYASEARANYRYLFKDLRERGITGLEGGACRGHIVTYPRGWRATGSPMEEFAKALDKEGVFDEV